MATQTINERHMWLTAFPRASDATLACLDLTVSYASTAANRDRPWPRSLRIWNYNRAESDVLCSKGVRELV